MSEGITILFQGDSITDAGRSREDDEELGRGYPHFVANMLAAKRPQLNFRFLNRGISGNRSGDLKARWREDCLALEPDFLTILIGINDTWRAFDRNDPTATEEYEANYRWILTKTRAETEAQIILLEPFVLPYPEDRLKWREDLDPKIAVVRKLAREFHTELITTDSLFAQAMIHKEPQFWAADGVHPTAGGHALIAQALLAKLESML